MVAARPRSMLQAMQQPVEQSGGPGDGSMSQGWESSPTNPASSFAGMLAAMATPKQNRTPVWNDDDLADDIATLSYERALRTHARYNYAGAGELAQTGVVYPVAKPMADGIPGAERPADYAAIPQAPRGTAASAETDPAHSVSMALNRNLKCASITIRLSEAECAQLRKRSAEAGLTVSAYLRSCTFEAESLRALVKDTLTQLRSAQSKGKREISKPARRSWLKGLTQLLAPWSRGERVIHA